MYYKIINKQTEVSPSTSNTRMTREELLELIDGFLAFNKSLRVLNTGEDKIAFYNKRSFYKVVEVK